MPFCAIQTPIMVSHPPVVGFRKGACQLAISSAACGPVKLPKKDEAALDPGTKKAPEKLVFPVE